MSILPNCLSSCLFLKQNIVTLDICTCRDLMVHFILFNCRWPCKLCDKTSPRLTERQQTKITWPSSSPRHNRFQSTWPWCCKCLFYVRSVSKGNFFVTLIKEVNDLNFFGILKIFTLHIIYEIITDLVRFKFRLPAIKPSPKLLSSQDLVTADCLDTFIDPLHLTLRLTSLSSPYCFNHYIFNSFS